MIWWVQIKNLRPFVWTIYVDSFVFETENRDRAGLWSALWSLGSCQTHRHQTRDCKYLKKKNISRASVICVLELWCASLVLTCGQIVQTIRHLCLRNQSIKIYTHFPCITCSISFVVNLEISSFLIIIPWVRGGRVVLWEQTLNSTRLDCMLTKNAGFRPRLAMCVVDCLIIPLIGWLLP